MLLGGDLGFLARVVVAGIVVVFAPVVGFLVRRKWRRTVARREEIKRLLVLASEEIERAEIEESGYSYDEYSYSSVVGIEATDGRPEEKEKEKHTEAVVAPVVEVPVQSPEAVQLSRRLQYQCEVCSSPTTTRCARCKAVRYCSGKCQIIHWRQGHKDECRAFTLGDPSHEIGASTSLKPSKVEEREVRNDVVGIGGKHPSDAVDTHSRKPAYSDPGLPKSSNRVEDDTNVEPLTEEKVSHSNLQFKAPVLLNELPKASSNGSSIDAYPEAHRPDLSDKHLSIPCPNKTENGRAGVDIEKPFHATPNAVNSRANFVSSVKANLMKSKSVDVDGLSGPSTSSSSSIDVCSESSSESCTSSSGFWDGTISLTRSRINALDDNADSRSDDAVDVDDVASQLTSHCTSGLAGTCLPRRDISISDEKKVLSDGSRLPVSEIKNPTNRPSSQIKVNKEDLDTQRSSAISSEAPQVDFSNSSSGKVPKFRGHGEFAVNLDAKAGISSPKTPDKLNSKAVGEGSISQMSKAYDDISSSNYGRNSVQNVKSVKSDSAHGPPSTLANSLDSAHNDRNNFKPSVWKVVDQLRASKLARLGALGIASENVTRYTNKCIFPYDVFVKLYHWNKIEMIPCGLVNCGNSCYANVVLQCLSFTPPLTAYFLQGLHSKSCKKTEWCFTCEFERLVLKAKEGNSPISPNRIISQLHNIGSHLGNGREEDAHEFLRCAIDTMQAGCLKAVGVSASSSLEETTLLGLTFGGYLRSKIECMRCGVKSEQRERMMDLTVEIEGDIGTLEEALRQFTHTETLDGENKYQCSRCNSYEKAKKKLRVLEAPNILTIALKRFQSGKFGKLNKMIKFPEILDLAPYMSGTSDKSPIYRLYGVIVHLDIMNASFSGHYVCYVKNTQSKWFKIDDSSVKAVELERVLTKGAYMLLYARCSPRAPRLIRRSSYDSTRKSKHPDSKPRYHTRDPWDSSVNDFSNNQMRDECCLNYSSFKPIHAIWEDDSSSDKSSSLFSEANSNSTDSSNRDSMFADDFFDQILGDMGVSCSSPWRNSSDSETSSSTSSPYPWYPRHSTIGSEAYSSGYPETGDYYGDSAAAALNNSSTLANHSEAEVAQGRGSRTFLCPDSTNRSRKLGSSSSCRETGSSKLGWANPLESLKSSVNFRRSTRERSD